MKRLLYVLAAIGALSSVAVAAPANDFECVAARCRNREAVERVRHAHRLEAPAFEQVLPPAEIERLVRLDVKKERTLRIRYGGAVSDEMIAEEARRIEMSTRAPEVLAELRRALNDDPIRFGETVVRPIVADRELRRQFENDDALHAPERRAAESARTALLEGRMVNGVREVAWRIGAPAREQEQITMPPVAATAAAQSGSYSVEAFVQVAQVLRSAPRQTDDAPRFEDIPAALQNVFKAQLKKPGDVTAVIESERGFQVFVARESTTTEYRAAVFNVPKRSFDEWLASQPEP